MSANYSKSRRDAIGSLNRGKTFSPVTIQRMSDAALARGPMSSETKALVSLNSAKAQLFEISLLDGSLLKDGSTSIILRTIPVVAAYISCGEKTVRRALTGTGIILSK
jgi:hypothetical protein